MKKLRSVRTKMTWLDVWTADGMTTIYRLWLPFNSSDESAIILRAVEIGAPLSREAGIEK